MPYKMHYAQEEALTFDDAETCCDTFVATVKKVDERRAANDHERDILLYEGYENGVFCVVYAQGEPWQVVMEGVPEWYWRERSDAFSHTIN